MTLVPKPAVQDEIEPGRKSVSAVGMKQSVVAAVTAVTERGNPIANAADGVMSEEVLVAMTGNETVNDPRRPAKLYAELQARGRNCDAETDVIVTMDLLIRADRFLVAAMPTRMRAVSVRRLQWEHHHPRLLPHLLRCRVMKAMHAAGDPVGTGRVDLTTAIVNVSAGGIASVTEIIVKVAAAQHIASVAVRIQKIVLALTEALEGPEWAMTINDPAVGREICLALSKILRER